MSDVRDWSTTAASNNDAPPDGSPEGMSPAAVNNAIREIMAAIARLYNDVQTATLTTGGSGDAYTLTTNQQFAALTDISVLAFQFDRANTGASPTLNIDSLGQKVMKQNGIEVQPEQIQANTVAMAAYNALDDSFTIFGVPLDGVLPKLSSAPPTRADTAFVYLRSKGGEDNIFFKLPDGSEVQLTANGQFNIDLSSSTLQAENIDSSNLIAELLTQSGYFRGKSVELTIDSGEVTIDWKAATVFEITNTESHTITFQNAPDTGSGEAQTIYVVYKNAGAHGIVLDAETGFTVERPANNPTDDLTGKTLLVCTAHGDSVIDVVPIKDFVSN